MGPLAALALGGTLIKGGAGIMSAIGGNQQAKAENTARNNLAIQRYNDTVNLQNYEWSQTLNVWNAKLQDYDRQTASINKALVDAYKGTQLDLNQDYTAAAFEVQDQFINELQALGKLNAKGVTGGSSKRIKALEKGSYARNTAILNAELEAKNQSAEQKNQMFANQAQSQKNQAYSNVAVAPAPPMRPSAPMLTPPPSNMGMITGIMGAVGGMATSIAGLDFGGGSSLPGAGALANRDSLAIGQTDWGSAGAFGDQNFYSMDFSNVNFGPGLG